MYIKHISDTHGKLFYHDNKSDILIHSGDMLPNSPCILGGDIDGEIEFQRNWVKKNISLFPKEFLFVLGNHDFLDPNELESIFQDSGIKAINLAGKVTNIGPFRVVGFSWINFIAGRWKYEVFIPEMKEKVNELMKLIQENDANMIVAHAPLEGILDYSWEHNKHFGNGVLRNSLDYEENNIRYYLHGHVHEAFGVSFQNGLFISNAATSCNYIEF